MKKLVDWLKSFLSTAAPEMETEPKSPPLTVVSSLISRASDSKEEKGDGVEKKDEAPDDEKDSDQDEGGGKKGCSFALKRNIVTSLQEIRKFAEENNLGSVMVKALLTLLAEMALGALKGKVSAGVLDTLLKVFNFETAVADAYNRGMKNGRDTKIEEEFFPKGDDGLPHFNGLTNPPQYRPEIFDIAKEV